MADIFTSKQSVRKLFLTTIALMAGKSRRPWPHSRRRTFFFVVFAFFRSLGLPLPPKPDKGMMDRLVRDNIDAARRISEIWILWVQRHVTRHYCCFRCTFFHLAPMVTLVTFWTEVTYLVAFCCTFFHLAPEVVLETFCTESPTQDYHVFSATF